MVNSLDMGLARYEMGTHIKGSKSETILEGVRLKFE